MQEDRFNLAGFMIYNTIKSGTELKRFNDVLAKHDFHGYRPERMTDGAALRAALAEEFPKHHKIISVLGDKEKESYSFEVIKIESADHERNLYTHVLTATVRGGMVSIDENDILRQARIQSSFIEFTTLVPGSQVARTLVDIVHSLRGLTMKEEGHIYWLPIEHWERWRPMCDDLWQINPACKFNACRIVFDGASIKGITEALTSEIERESKEIAETLSDDDTGLRAAGTARRRAEMLRDKIAEYEIRLGLTLDVLKTKLDEATAVEAKAAVMDVACQLSLLTYAE